MAKRTFHAVADLFPMMAADELESLVDDIKTNGLQVPIVVDAEGNILDGRHRFMACEKAGVEPIFITTEAADPVALVASLNAKRRNLSASQRAIAAAEAWDMQPANARGQPKKNFPINGEIKGGRAVALSRQFGVARGMVEQARAVVVNDPPAAASVKTGAIRLVDAFDAVRQRLNAAESEKALLTQLQAEDSDLAGLVVEGQLKLSEAMAAQRERKEKARLERQAAMQTLHAAMINLSPYDGDAKVKAESIWRSWDKSLFPTGPLKLNAESLTKCAAVLSALAAFVRKKESPP